MNPDEFGLVEPFDTDDGSLDNISAEEAFALGVEWEIWRQKLNSGQSFRQWCLENNAQRLAKMVARHNRHVEIRQTDWPGWSDVAVGGYLV